MKPTADVVLLATPAELSPRKNPVREARHKPRARRDASYIHVKEFLGLDGLLVKTALIRDPAWVKNRHSYKIDHRDADAAKRSVSSILEALRSKSKHRAWYLYVAGTYVIAAHPLPYDSITRSVADQNTMHLFARKVATNALLTGADGVIAVGLSPASNDTNDTVARLMRCAQIKFSNKSLDLR